MTNLQEDLLIQKERVPTFNSFSKLCFYSISIGSLFFGVIGFSILYAIIFHDTTKTQYAESSTSDCGCPDIAVTLPNLGVVNGLNKLQTYEFLGVPFALPPVGIRRWLNPQPYNISFPKEGYPATYYRASCFQGTDATTQPQGISEDCLYLNIFMRKDGFNQKLPVLVWTYGGGGVFGGAGQSVPALYNGTNLILNSDLNVIVVTINYRLGAFSDLYLSELVSEDTQYHTSGEYNHLDVQMAYKWVQQYISLFGGDPLRVIGFGESAGANMAAMQTVLKGSEGLISGLIHESGTWALPLAFAQLNQTKTASRTFVSLAGCDDLNAADTLTCIRKLTSGNVVELASQVGSGFDSLRQAVDGVLIADEPQQLLLDGRVVNKVPMMWGFNTQDAFTTACYGVSPDYVVTEDAYNLTMYLNFHYQLGLNLTSVNRILEQYPFKKCYVPNNQPLTLSQCCNFLQDSPMNYVWRCQARRIFKLEANYDPRLFLYFFGQYPTCPISYNACSHTDEVAYVFGTQSHYLATGLEPACSWNTSERQFSSQVSSMWKSFSSVFNPSLSNLTFPTFVPGKSESGLYLQADKIQPFVLTEEQENMCENFWEPLLWDMFKWFQNGGTGEEVNPLTAKVQSIPISKRLLRSGKQIPFFRL